MAPVALTAYFAELVRQGGPGPEDYDGYTAWAQAALAAVEDGRMSRSDLERILDSAGDATSSTRTMQGLVRARPHGYAGDFEVIDRIYQFWHSPDARLIKWDRFFHAQAAPRAVRNRKSYLHTWLKAAEERYSGSPVRLINVGSGPARDLQEYFLMLPSSRVACTCIEHDQRAITYARSICAREVERVSFLHTNAFNFRPVHAPHLIWSAGLFDYLDDRRFVVLFRHLSRTLAPGGEIVIGNFCPRNPSRAYMKLGGWVLHERDHGHLIALARKAGFSESQIQVGSEAEGVNLFLHARK